MHRICFDKNETFTMHYKRTIAQTNLSKLQIKYLFQTGQQRLLETD